MAWCPATAAGQPVYKGLLEAAGPRSSLSVVHDLLFKKKESTFPEFVGHNFLLEETNSNSFQRYTVHYVSQKTQWSIRYKVNAGSTVQQSVRCIKS